MSAYLKEDFLRQVCEVWRRDAEATECEPDVIRVHGEEVAQRGRRPAGRRARVASGSHQGGLVATARDYHRKCITRSDPSASATDGAFHTGVPSTRRSGGPMSSTTSARS